MARIGAILTLLLSIAAFLTCGIAFSNDSRRIAEASGGIGFFLFVTSMVLFAIGGRKAKDGAVKAKKKKA